MPFLFIDGLVVQTASGSADNSKLRLVLDLLGAAQNAK